MHPVIVHILALVAVVGKAAVGGAGLVLAGLGALNLALAFPTHGWVMDATSLWLPYLVSLGALLGAGRAYARHPRA
jgi:hypothetical protein